MRERATGEEPAHTERGSGLELIPKLHLRPLDNFIIVACSFVPFVLLWSTPVILGGSVVVIPSNLVHPVTILGVEANHGVLLQRLNTRILVSARVEGLRIRR